ncbi:MAG: uridine kinase [Verrucomicrobiota bacterium]
MKTPYIILIAGPSGSGKSTFAQGLASHLDAKGHSCEVIALDNYYRDLSHMTEEERNRHDFDQPDAWERERLIADAEKLRMGRPIEMPIYDFNSHLRTAKTATIQTNDYIIMEGLFALCYPELNTIADLKIYIELEDSFALARRIERDTRERGRSRECIIAQYATTVRPANQKHIHPSASNADVHLHGTHPLADQLREIRGLIYPE